MRKLAEKRKLPSKVKVIFPLDQKQWPKMHAETMWARPINSRNFELLNSPFYAYGISFGDIIRVHVVDNQLSFDRVVKRSGHSTYRVLLSRDIEPGSQGFRKYWNRLQKLGCTYELARKRWLSIDVPPDADILKAYRILEKGEEDGIWVFDEGHCGHRVNLEK